MSFEKEIEKIFGKESVSRYMLNIFDDCVYVEGVKRLIAVKNEGIAFSIKGGEISLYGNLRIVDSGRGYLAIKGKVESVEIRSVGKDKDNRQNKK